jgi:hypothetical protein
MTLVIDDPDLERTLRTLAAERGESVEEVVRNGVRGLGARTGSVARPAESAQDRRRRFAQARRIVDRIYAEIRHDRRTAEEILGYDADGLPR